MCWFSHGCRSGGRHNYNWINLLIYAPPRTAPEKMPHETAPQRTTREQNAALFRFLSTVTLTFDLWPWHSNSGESFVQFTAKFHHPMFIIIIIIILFAQTCKYNCNNINHSENKRTNRRRWKHPPRSAMLRGRVIIPLMHTQQTAFPSAHPSTQQSLFIFHAVLHEMCCSKYITVQFKVKNYVRF